ncbi:hypothetical protein Hanom_Chr00s202765g01838391 [Helianthus anomalus]
MIVDLMEPSKMSPNRLWKSRMESPSLGIRNWVLTKVFPKFTLGTSVWDAGLGVWDAGIRSLCPVFAVLLRFSLLFFLTSFPSSIKLPKYTLNMPRPAKYKPSQSSVF